MATKQYVQITPHKDGYALWWTAELMQEHKGEDECIGSVSVGGATRERCERAAMERWPGLPIRVTDPSERWGE